MISAEQAEALARETVQKYVAACACGSAEDVANVLMKLASMCGLGMCAVVGHADAVQRLQGTTDYIATTQADKTWQHVRMH